MRLRYYRVELPLEHVFTIARDSRTTQVSVIVELEDGGLRGYGEATENRYYGVTSEAIIEMLEHCREVIESPNDWQPYELWDRLYLRLSEHRFILAAIDSAAHDLYGKQSKRRTFETLGLTWNDVPCSSYTIGIDSIERMIEKLIARRDWPIFKIKLGTDHDVEIVKRLREHTEAIFRIDANCGWTASETIDNSVAMKELGVEFIEQPLPANASIEDQRKVFQESLLPIVADESCLIESDVRPCSILFHGINVKLSKCGGVTPAIRMLRNARELGLKTMIGCMVESTVGISAAAQLLPLLDYADLDGAELLAADIAEGIAVRNGRVVPQSCHGNGVTLPDQLVTI
ncbi:dipeptide epimerase [Roseiconus lacunae]|uniref:Dipeptide epimerase n=1 Tax=Roseiconus lacunae TaxID=2605694 RepID=A0ABT7PBQ1_9BACT|nr:dipeptide epimerase [Roseiconus lacunae]MDM4013919.1 dipeptide epimerase [Roseiconus lacunae]